MSTAEDTASEKREYGSGTVGGAGFGNKSNADPSDLDNSDTRFGSGHKVDPYSGASKYGSGATAGVGAGNKLEAVSSADSAIADDETRYGLSTNKDPYSNSTGFGSGSTAGAGWGNKTADGFEQDSHNDSTMGKLMQKAGGIFGHKGMKDKGQAKREAAGYGEDLKDTDAPDGDGEAAESLRARDVEGLAEADR